MLQPGVPCQPCQIAGMRDTFVGHGLRSPTRLTSRFNEAHAHLRWMLAQH